MASKRKYSYEPGEGRERTRGGSGKMYYEEEGGEGKKQKSEPTLRDLEAKKQEADQRYKEAKNRFDTARSKGKNLRESRSALHQAARDVA